MAHHGGIFCRGFVQDWSKAQVYTVQNGRGTRGFKSRMNGDWVSGPETLSEEQLGRNRRDFYEDCISRKLDTDDYWQSRMPDWTKVKVPLLSAANWGGQGLHPRGNFEGFVRAASEQKWLEVHGIEHWTHFYTNYGVELQKKFFGHFLKGEDTGWNKQPKVLLQVRHPGEKFVERHENEWPLARTQWTKFYLHPADMTMSTGASEERASRSPMPGFGDGVTFLTEPLEAGHRDHRPDRRQAVGVVGDRGCRSVPGGARVHAGPEGGHLPGRARCRTRRSRKAGCAARTASSTRSSRCRTGPITPTTRSRSSSRARSTRSTSKSGRPASCCRRAIGSRCPCAATTTSIRASRAPALKTLGKVWTGVGPFTHDDPRDRPPAVFGGDVTLHAGPDRQAYVLLPVIPKK